MKETYDELKKEDPAGTPTHSTTGMPHPKEVTLERMYQYMDANKDGKVTPEELKAFFYAIGEPLQYPNGTFAPDEFAMMQLVDKNHDGSASWDEMKEMLYKPSDHLRE
jgi:Ca2+-binding EF-hand superfamily protein